MNIVLLGAAGFIGTNLVLKLAEEGNFITLVDKKMHYFDHFSRLGLENIRYIETDFSAQTDFKQILYGQDVVYHLFSSTIPANSGKKIIDDFTENVIATMKMLDSCVDIGIKKVVFLSSGGTVYGKDIICPVKEDDSTNPINSYGVQKLTIEKILYLYNCIYQLDYRIIRLSNPYGPFQRPNGKVGVITTLVFKALNGEKIDIYGDGSVIRDFIYIDDAINAIINIVNGPSDYRLFNVGSGVGTSILEVIELVKKVIKKDMIINYYEGRTVDVPINILNVERYIKCYGEIQTIKLEDGISRTVEFIKNYY